jgi:hypothetical protein
MAGPPDEAADGQPPQLIRQVRMTTTSRFLFATVAILTLSICALQARSSRADQLFSVSLTPAASAVPAGSDGVVIVRLESQQADLPGLTFDAAGGEITGIVPLNSTGAGTAEGALHVRRDTPGTAHVTASFGGSVLAESDLRFAQMGAVGVSVTLDAGPDAAARTWQFEVTNPSGALVTRLSVGTSGDKPTASAVTPPLPYGFYTVRQVLGNDTKLACAGGAFYELTAPVSGETTLQLDSSSANAAFTIKPCGELPASSVSIPVDTITTPAAGGFIGDALPGETPINEVRGARQEGPGAAIAAATPLAPTTGSGIASDDDSTNSTFEILAIALGLALLGASVAAYRQIQLDHSHRR